MKRSIRLRVYRETLSNYLSIYPKTIGLCKALTDSAIDLKVNPELIHYGTENYPEIHKRKPKIVHSAYWFPLHQAGKRNRIDILKKAINEIEKAINYEAKAWAKKRAQRTNPKP